MFENTKKLVEQMTGAGRPAPRILPQLVRARKANTMFLEDDGIVPNHPAWPLVHYKSPVRLPARFDAAAVLESLFEANRWTHSWRNGIYDYIHYHSRTHEVLGVAAGHAELRLGGREGRRLIVKRGDVLVLPAGTGHSRLSASDDFLVVGAYPEDGVYDECRDYIHHHDRAIKTVGEVPRPAADPVYGPDGPLKRLWKETPA